MTFDMIILAAMVAGAWMWAIADYRAAVRARAAHRRKFLRCEMRVRHRALMKELRREVARARLREERAVGITGVKHPDMAAYIADAEARRGREAKIEIVGRRNRA